MNSILLSSPFPAPPPSAIVASDIASSATVAPIQAGASASSSGDAASFSGSGAGSGTSRQGETVALFKANGNNKWARPPTATGGSVIGAQARDNAEPAPLGPDLPEVEMPDPLPTSPFLRIFDGAA